MAPKSPTVKKKRSYIWIYGTPTFRNGSFEFHHKVQDFIEKSWAAGKAECKIYVFGEIWTLNFTDMTRKIESDDGWAKIKRISQSKAKKCNLLGISGARYLKNGGFQQTDNICNICLYTPSIPTRIEGCGHVFCFVCLKSNYKMGLDCPTCRGHIPSYLVRDVKRYDVDIDIDCPEEYANDCSSMFTVSEEGKEPAKQLRRSQRVTRTKFYWLYQSDDYGWFRYDPKNEKYLEESYMRRKNRCSIFICGYKMTINLKTNVQERVTEGEVFRRRIKRIPAVDVKKHRVRGISGILSHCYPIETD